MWMIDPEVVKEIDEERKRREELRKRDPSAYEKLYGGWDDPLGGRWHLLVSFGIIFMCMLMMWAITLIR